MGDRQEPFDERQAAGELVVGVGVGELEMDGLLVVGRGVAVIDEHEVDGDSVAEAGEL